MPQQQGPTTTFTTDNSLRIVRRVDDDLSVLEPNEGPLITFTQQMKRTKSTDTPRLEWYEDDYVARWALLGATPAGAGDATITLADGTLVVPGDMLVTAPLDTSNAVPEILRVTSMAGNVATVSRAVAGTTAGAIAAGAALRIIGSAYQENDPIPQSKVRSPVRKLSYTQIFRTTMQFSKTQVATKVYNAASGERQREHRKKLKEHKIAMNGAFLFGKASETMDPNSTGRPLRTTMGLNSVVSANGTAVDAGGSLTWKTFEEFSRRAFRYGKSTKLLLCAPLIKSAINTWGHNKLFVTPGETKFGVKINRVYTAHGEWLITNDWMLEDAPGSTTAGFGAMGFSLDMDAIEMRYLSDNGENRNTHLIENAVQDGRDGVYDEILTEAGLVIKQPLYHTKLYNVTDFADV